MGKTAAPEDSGGSITKTVFPRWLILAIVGGGLACCVGLTACWVVVLVRRRRRAAEGNLARRSAAYASDGGAPATGQWAAPAQQQPEGRGKGKAKRLVPANPAPSGGRQKGRPTRTPQHQGPPVQSPPPRSHANVRPSSAEEDEDEDFGRMHFSGRQPSGGLPAKRTPSGGEWWVIRLPGVDWGLTVDQSPAVSWVMRFAVREGC
jgi:hypothetical protein